MPRVASVRPGQPGSHLIHCNKVAELVTVKYEAHEAS
jgi:hypothetical protein